MKYAGIFAICSLIIGGLYGIISGIVLEPALFAFVITGVIVSINFTLSLVIFVFTLIFYCFNKQSPRLNKYHTYSLTFMLIFFPALGLIKLLNISIF